MQILERAWYVKVGDRYGICDAKTVLPTVSGYDTYYHISYNSGSTGVALFDEIEFLYQL